MNVREIGEVYLVDDEAVKLAPALDAAGFTGTSKGLFKRVSARRRE